MVESHGFVHSRRHALGNALLGARANLELLAPALEDSLLVTYLDRAMASLDKAAGLLAVGMPDRGDGARPDGAFAGPPPAAGEDDDPSRMVAGLDVLIVENDAAVRDLLAGLLAAAGASVCALSTARAAGTYLADRTFDLVVLDRWLDGDMDGLALVRAYAGCTRVLLVTGDADAAPDATAPGQHWTTLLKPFRVDGFWRAVATALAQPLKRPEAGAG